MALSFQYIFNLKTQLLIYNSNYILKWHKLHDSIVLELSSIAERLIILSLFCTGETIVGYLKQLFLGLKWEWELICQNTHSFCLTSC